MKCVDCHNLVTIQDAFKNELHFVIKAAKK